jgi:hypothetical protein
MSAKASVIAISAALIVAVGIVVAALVLRPQSPRPGQPAGVTAQARRAIPVRAKSAVRLLLSARGRKALTPELNAALPQGSKGLFPAGSTFTPNSASWRQSGAYANLTGMLREPGKAPATIEIGLVYRHGAWLVTFEAAR